MIADDEKSFESAFAMANKFWGMPLTKDNLASLWNLTCEIQKKYGIEDAEFWPKFENTAGVAIKNALLKDGGLSLLYHIDKENLDALAMAVKKFGLNVADENLQAKAKKSIGLNVGFNQCQTMECTRQIFGIPLGYYESEEFLKALKGRLGFLKGDFVKGYKKEAREIIDLMNSPYFSDKTKAFIEKDVLQMYELKGVKKILEGAGQQNDFITVYTVAEELGKDWRDLAQAVRYFTVDEIIKIVDGGAKIKDAAKIIESLVKDGADGNEITALKNKISLSQMIAIAKSGQIDQFINALKAGFGIGEIERFPFLTSQLLK